MNLADVPRIFAEEAKRCGLPAGWRLEFINSVRRFGQCSDGRKVIDMSRKLCSINTEERVRKTIVHEIAHALVGCRHGHDHVWKAKDIELGGDGVRCSLAGDHQDARATMVSGLPRMQERIRHDAET